MLLRVKGKSVSEAHERLGERCMRGAGRAETKSAAGLVDEGSEIMTAHESTCCAHSAAKTEI